MSSPVRIGARGPEQSGQHRHPMLLEGLSRGRVSPRLRDLRVREGVKVVNLMAVADLARDVAGLRDAGGNYRSWLDDWSTRFRSEIRAWIGDRSPDPRLAEFLDSFVHRGDKQQADALQKTLDRGQVPERDREAIWTAYERCGNDGDKRVFVDNVFNSMRISGGGDGRRGGGFRGRVGGTGRDEREL
ncbi:hypothetical protein [Kribbella rubisoli]|uniref:hypothetical protein n=1 Tax=Kribbella rubisoli TaxID=3075929 RepID=UPI00102BF00F|nr:hypothetical protein [Kribbella rubisoli]